MKKVHAVVARGTFGTENVQSTPGSDDFWKLRCRKSARRCGEAHVRVKMYKNTRGSDHVLTIPWRFDVENVHAVVARNTCGSQMC